MRNIIKYITAFSFAVSLCVPSYADGGKTAEEAIKVSKTVKYDSEGEVSSLEIETYVTGDGENTTKTTEITTPMDIVLVLDVSGSMDDNSYSAVGNGNDQSVLANLYKNNTEAYVSMLGMRKVTITKNNNEYSGKYTFWGVTYSIGSKTLYVKSSYKKIDALKAACASFIDSIKTSAAGSGGVTVDHRISVVKFAGDKRDKIGNDMYTYALFWKYNYTQVVVKNSKDYEGIKSSVLALKPGGCTAVDYGMEYAKTILDGISSDRKSNKLVVMFTDGEPNHLDGFDSSVANSAIATSKEIKVSATVYTVGTFEDASGNVEKYMEYVSSKYPKASSLDNAGSETKTDKTYSMIAASAEELKQAFETISQSETGGTSKADYYLETSKVTLRDIITPHFQIPEGSSVTFKAVPFIKPDESLTKNGTWGTAEAVTGVTYETSVDTDGKTYVDVKGFDFNNNWVGYTVTKNIINGTETITKIETHGKKLVMEIAIEPAPNSDGGVVPTNATGSGVVYGSDAHGVVPLVNYVSNPTTVTTNKVNLIVKKSGLKPGESILYTVTRSNDTDFKLTLVLSADANGNAEAKAKVPSKKNGQKYTYSVVEDPTWAWAYKTSTVSAKTLYNSSNALDNVFDFGKAVPDTAKSGVLHSEDSNRNVFNK